MLVCSKLRKEALRRGVLRARILKLGGAGLAPFRRREHHAMLRCGVVFVEALVSLSALAPCRPAMLAVPVLVLVLNSQCVVVRAVTCVTIGTCVECLRFG